jgi:two-component system cell cycle sensor histidine kinase/response regulator CckA
VSHTTRGRRVLVMDDQEALRELVKNMLGTLDCVAEVAADGKQAIEKVRRANAAGRGFDLVILDLTIPGGMGGVKTLRELLRHDPRARVIVSSGYSNDPVMADCRRYGFVDALPKPFTAADLGRVLERALSRHSRTTEDA